MTSGSGTDAPSEPDDVIAPDDPDAPDIARLLDIHLAHCQAQSPPEDVHALTPGQRSGQAITFYSLRLGGELLAIGALKELAPDHGELKSMHTVERARRQGAGRAMLDHLVKEGRRRGYRRLSLETGSMEAFAPARQMYANAGFEVCPPFAHYRRSPNSTCMTLQLSRQLLFVAPPGHRAQVAGKFSRYQPRTRF